MKNAVEIANVLAALSPEELESCKQQLMDGGALMYGDYRNELPTDDDTPKKIVACNSKRRARRVKCER